MNPQNELDLTIALETIHDWALKSGDLGYAYWYQVGKLLESAAVMNARLLELEAEVERLRKRKDGSRRA